MHEHVYAITDITGVIDMLRFKHEPFDRVARETRHVVQSMRAVDAFALIAIITVGGSLAQNMHLNVVQGEFLLAGIELAGLAVICTLFALWPWGPSQDESSD